jgi:uncharacterized membrane protein
MKRLTLMDAFVFFIWLLPIIYLAFIYPSLPERVAVHFNIEGHPDREGSKKEILFVVGLLTVLSAGLYYLMKWLPKIDPKRNAKTSPSSFKKIGHAVVLLMSCIGVAITYSAVGGQFTFNQLMLPTLGLFFAYMGNIMYSIKPNYFAGIRTPWALENEDNWKATHRLAGKLWFVGGIIISISAFFLSPKTAMVFFIAGIAVMTIVPFAYSYLYFKKYPSQGGKG